MTRLDIADIKALLIERLDALVGELVPGAIAKGDHWEARSPLRVDRRSGSFCVWRRGKVAGGWKDFASDEKGDVLDLVACVRCGANVPPTREDRVAAIKWAKGWLGLAVADPAELARVREKAKRQASAAQLREVEERKRKRRRAHEIWMSGRDWRGSPVEAYLRARGVDVERIGAWDDGLRYAPRLSHWVESHVGPAMLGAFRHPKSGFSGLHATFLLPDGSGKADLDRPKLMMGSVAGAAIRLTRGESERTLEELESDVRAIGRGCAGELALCEGIEDAVTVAAARPELRCWAVGSLGNLGAQPASAAISAYLVCADNDWGKPAAVASFEKQIAALKRHGVPVAVARAHAGKDMNDLARV